MGQRLESSGSVQPTYPSCCRTTSKILFITRRCAMQGNDKVGPKNKQFGIHINMWKHYDNFRQAKNGAFSTANSILAGIAGLTFTNLQRRISAAFIKYRYSCPNVNYHVFPTKERA
jgi:hypothetical protein